MVWERRHQRTDLGSDPLCYLAPPTLVPPLALPSPQSQGIYLPHTHIHTQASTHRHLPKPLHSPPTWPPNLADLIGWWNFWPKIERMKKTVCCATYYVINRVVIVYAYIWFTTEHTFDDKFRPVKRNTFILGLYEKLTSLQPKHVVINHGKPKDTIHFCQITLVNEVQWHFKSTSSYKLTRTKLEYRIDVNCINTPRTLPHQAIVKKKQQKTRRGKINENLETLHAD